MSSSPERRRRGRRSLNGGGDSPQLRVRLPDALREALSRRASEEGITVSELVRRVLTDAAYGSSDPERPASHRRNLTGPLGRRLRRHRREVLDTAAAQGLSNVRVFGSVARSEERPDSDIDLLVDIPDGMGLIGLSRARASLERILHAPVDLIPASDLKYDVAAATDADAVPL